MKKLVWNPKPAGGGGAPATPDGARPSSYVTVDASAPSVPARQAIRAVRVPAGAGAPDAESPLVRALQSEHHDRAATRSNLLPEACASGALTPKLRVPDAVKCKNGPSVPSLRVPEAIRCRRGPPASAAAAAPPPPPPPARTPEKTRCRAPGRVAEKLTCGRFGRAAPPPAESAVAMADLSPRGQGDLFAQSEGDWRSKIGAAGSGAGAGAAPPPSRAPEKTRCRAPAVPAVGRVAERVTCGRLGRGGAAPEVSVDEDLFSALPPGLSAREPEKVRCKAPSVRIPAVPGRAAVGRVAEKVTCGRLGGGAAAADPRIERESVVAMGTISPSGSNPFYDDQPGYERV